MTKNDKEKLERLKEICDKDPQNPTIFVSKSGVKYVKALSSLFELKNKNDKPFTKDEILDQPKIGEFDFPGLSEFKYTCDLQARPLKITTSISDDADDVRENEKILASNFQNNQEGIYNSTQGIVYMLTCKIDENEYIIKFGQSRTSFKKRLKSYNTGVVWNWRTASTTNIKILQSFVTTRLPFKLYLLTTDKKQKFEWHGIKSVPFPTSKSLAFEDIIVKEFCKKFNKKPLANIQAKATVVK